MADGSLLVADHLQGLNTYKYVRVIVLDGNIPSLQYHLLMLAWVAAVLLIGGLIYKKCNHKFLYYV